eukprot:GHUV01032745.1.p2 GENE.GHUV01032745.1~~GHUV01032745.1.p2  ORF type:complete len:131 (-),score=33.17 GHUV01032745.1:447-839(-)
MLLCRCAIPDICAGYAGHSTVHSASGTTAVYALFCKLLRARHICMFACHCREDIAWTLQTLSPNALELSRLWHECGYASARLLDVATVDLLERLPVKVLPTARWHVKLRVRLPAVKSILAAPAANADADG